MGDVEATLTAALAEPEVADQVRSGRLTKTVSYAGFGEAPRPQLRLVHGGKESVPEAPAPPAQSRRETERAERAAPEREAEAERRAAEREAEAQRRAAEREAERAAEAQRRRERAAAHREVLAARTELAEAEAVRVEAERAVTAARRRVEKAMAALRALGDD